MAREIVAVQNLTETESLKLIETHLQKAPRRRKIEEGQPSEAETSEALAEDADIDEAA
jgi:CarD family transcriptional regulator